jgi:hypothetical protein
MTAQPPAFISSAKRSSHPAPGTISMLNYSKAG